MSIFSHLSCPYRLPDSLKFVSIFSHLSHIIYFLLRLLKREENFTFIPRSREELPDNFPKEIPGICYFLEVRTGPKQPKPSLSSSKIKKVSYNIGTMFLRETSLWDLLQIKDSSKKHKPGTWVMTGEWREIFLFYWIVEKTVEFLLCQAIILEKDRLWLSIKTLESKGAMYSFLWVILVIYILYMYNTYICILINYKCGAHLKLINSLCFLVCHTYRYLYIFVLLLKASFDYIFLHLVSWYERNIF